MNIQIEKMTAVPVFLQNIEIVERKGLGHPDHIIDSACEAISRALSRYYLKRFGKILHHNVDKGLLVGGSARWSFGGGEVLEPIEIIIAGRATKEVDFNGTIEEIDVDSISVEAVKREIRNNFRFLDPDKHVDIKIKVRPGSAELIKTFEKGIEAEVPLANDTSFGVAFAPLTSSEMLALKLELYLNSNNYKQKRPFVGEDVKIMILRRDKNYDITIAAAFIDKFFSSVSEYLAAKEEVYNDILDYIANFDLDYNNLNVKLNAADDPTNMNIYLTVTGTSAETGDDGNTGRSNRVHGLITPNRQMSLEAIAGKNPVSHVGKLYNILAYNISNKIYSEVDGIEEVYTRILSTIGHPINDPQIISIQYISTKESINVENKIRKIIEEEMDIKKIKQITYDILNGKYIMF